MIANFYLDPMKKIPNNIFNKVESVAKTVLADFKNKGYVIPTQDTDGSIRFEHIVVRKETTGFYSVVDDKNRVYADHINLQQTAALIANDVALGKIVDNKLLELDRNYGYKVFDEELFRRNYKRKKNTIDQQIYYKTRMDDAASKAKYIKSSINQSFLKLSRIA